jgi:hypothetical protein
MYQALQAAQRAESRTANGSPIRVPSGAGAHVGPGALVVGGGVGAGDRVDFATTHSWRKPAEAVPRPAARLARHGGQLGSGSPGMLSAAGVSPGGLSPGASFVGEGSQGPLSPVVGPVDSPLLV